MKAQWYLIPIILVSLSFTPTPISWKELETGLHYASIESPIKSTHADSKIDILKINPTYFAFDLLCAGEKKTDAKKADQWCEQYKMVAGVNSSMFQLKDDFKQSTGYMRHNAYVNNGTLNPSYKNIFAFHTNDTVAPHILDITCQNWKSVKNKYNSFSQSIRMLDCASKNTWQVQPKKWSMVLLAEDKDGNILFIFVRSPYRVYDFVNILTSLPLHLKKLMYLEGGPEASFYIHHPKLSIQKFGSYETGFNENDNNKVYWDIPNMIAIRRKQ